MGASYRTSLSPGFEKVSSCRRPFRSRNSTAPKSLLSTAAFFLNSFLSEAVRILAIFVFEGTTGLTARTTQSATESSVDRQLLLDTRGSPTDWKP